MFKIILIFLFGVYLGSAAAESVSKNGSWFYSRYADYIDEEVTVNSYSRSLNKPTGQTKVKSGVVRIINSTKPGSKTYSEFVQFFTVGGAFDCGKKFNKCTGRLRPKNGKIIHVVVNPLLDSIYNGRPLSYHIGVKKGGRFVAFEPDLHKDSFSIEITEVSGTKNRFKFSKQETTWLRYVFMENDVELSEDDFLNLNRSGF